MIFMNKSTSNRFQFTVPDLFRNGFGKFIQGDASLVAAASGTDGNGSVLHFLVAHDEHIGDLLSLCLTDLVARRRSAR